MMVSSVCVGRRFSPFLETHLSPASEGEPPEKCDGRLTKHPSLLVPSRWKITSSTSTSDDLPRPSSVPFLASLVRCAAQQKTLETPPGVSLSYPRGFHSRPPKRWLQHYQWLVEFSSISQLSSKAPITSLTLFLFSVLLLLQEFGLDHRESESLLRKHPQLADVHTESLRRRIASLRSLGIDGFELPSTIIKSADLITSSEMDAFLDIIHENLQDLQPTKLLVFLAAADTRALSTFQEKVRLLTDHGVPRERLGRFLNSLNLRKVFCDKTTEEMEATILYLKGLDGFGWLLRRPQLLNLDLKRQLVPRVKFLVDLGGGDKSAAAILIGKLPYMLAYSVKQYTGHLEFWHSIGLGNEEFFKLALVYPSIFSVSRDQKLEPRVSFLRECGLEAMEIHRFLMKAPLFLSLSFDSNLAKKLALLVKIGYKHGTKDLAAAMGWATRTSCENMQMVVGLLLEWGFSCEDVMAMARRQPQVLQYNHASLAKKVEYLVWEMDREIGELLAFPAFLGYKLDDRIKRRYEAKKERRGKAMSINKLLSVSAERFSWDDEQQAIF